MIKAIHFEELCNLLKGELEAWNSLAGGPNPDAEEFDKLTADKKLLKTKGYFSNREAWIAGIRVKKIKQFLQDHNIVL